MLAASVATGGLSASLPAKSWAIYGVKVYIERAGLFSSMALPPLNYR
jgi:hypothetical protein